MGDESYEEYKTMKSYVEFVNEMSSKEEEVEKEVLKLVSVSNMQNNWI
jgi:hypothetical protein